MVVECSVIAYLRKLQISYIEYIITGSKHPYSLNHCQGFLGSMFYSWLTVGIAIVNKESF